MLPRKLLRRGAGLSALMTFTVMAGLPISAQAERVLYYSFSEGGGSSITNQGTLEGDGVLNNETAWGAGPAGFGPALNLPDGDFYVDTGFQPADLNIGTGDYTAMAWIKLDVPVAGDFMVFGQLTGNYFHLGIRGALYYFGHYANDISSGAVSVETGVWKHVTWVYRAGVEEIWVDGVLANSAAFGPLVNPDPTVVIGRAVQSTDNDFIGGIDEVKVFDTALSEAEIISERDAMPDDPDPRLFAPEETGLGQIAAIPAEVNGSFILRNIGGSETLTITNVAVTGGANADNFSITDFPTSLAPFEEGEVSYTFNRLDDQGGLSADVTVSSNDVDQPERTIRLTASIINLSGPVAYYRFDDQAGATEAIDSSGFDRTGSYEANTGSVTLQEPGLTETSGTALSVSGGGSVVVEAGMAPVLEDFTISLWAGVASSGGVQTLVAKGGEGGIVFALTVGSDGVLGWFQGDGDGPDFSSDPGLIGEGPHHIAVSYASSGQNLKVIVDGVAVIDETGVVDTDSGSVLMDLDTTNLYIGSFTNGILALNGTLDDVQIYNRALSDADVTVLRENPGTTLAGLTEIDSDGDGLSDQEEFELGTDPLNPDTDGDGVSDGDEVNVYQTNPLERDSDGGGAWDGIEVAQGTDPNDGTDDPGVWTVRTIKGSVALNNTTDMANLIGGANLSYEVTHQHEFVNFIGGGGGSGNYPDDIMFDIQTTLEEDVDDFAVVATTTIFIEEGGPYTFGFNSDDGGEVIVGDIPVATFAGTRGAGNSLGVITLAPGFHQVEARMFERAGGAAFEVFWNPETGDHTDAFAAETFELLTGTDVKSGDTDGDGMDDSWEMASFGTLDRDGAGDFDEDGLTDLQEFELGSDATNSDSDGDGLTDGDEVNTYGTNPILADTDGDGLSDGDEISIHETDPLVVDTDGDGIGDGAEVKFGGDPLNPGADDGLGLFEVRNAIAAEGVVFTTVDDFIALLDEGTQIADESLTAHQTINFFETGAIGNFGDDEPFPLYGDFVDRSNYGIHATGVINIREAGPRTFGVNSDDGFRLAINGEMIAELPGARGAGDTFGTVDLDVGFHEVELWYFEIGGGAEVELFVNLETGTVTNFADGNFVLLPASILDEDGDGLDDRWELEYFGNLDETGENDSDSDGLTNAQEFPLGSDPTNADTDGDGLSDGDEVNEHGTNPALADSDQDGLSDGDEINVHQTDPTNPDTDGDGVVDGAEVLFGGDPLNGGSDDGLGEFSVRQVAAAPGIAFANLQSFLDVLDDETQIDASSNTSHRVINFFETGSRGNFENDDPFPLFGDFVDRSNYGIYATGQIQITEAGPRTFGVNSDDGFRLAIDGEIVTEFFDPRGAANSFGTVDLTEGVHTLELWYYEVGGGAAVELFVNLEPGEVTNFNDGTFALLPASAVDSDGDGLSDVWEQTYFGNLENGPDDDPDGDGLTNLQEFENQTNPTLADTDGDGLNDGDELTAGTDPLNADSDADGLSDGDEIAAGTDPLNEDSDGDGFTDGWEAATEGADPADPNLPADVASFRKIHFNFEDAAGATVGNSGTEGDGTIIGPQGADALVASSDSPSPNGSGALSPDAEKGVNATWVDTGISADALGLHGAVDYTVMAWINLASTGGDNMVFGQTGPAEGWFHHGVRETGYHFGHYGNDITAGTVEVGAWHHVAYRYQAGVASIIVDGVSIASGARGPLNSPEANLLIGAAQVDRAFHGLIDDVQVISAPLTPDKIAELAGLEGIAPITDSDGDGVSDESEAIAGTDPNDASDYLRLLAPMWTENGIMLEWTSVEGRSYVVEFSETLAADSWVTVATVDGAGGTTSYEDTDAERVGAMIGFYRARVVVE